MEIDAMKSRTAFSFRRSITVLVAAVLMVVVVATFSSIVETVKKGSYQIKQAAVTGTMTAKMDPGLWLQLFGDIQVWPKAETFYFTADSDEGARMDESIEVRFNDGSMCRISGTCRIILPTDPTAAINVITEQGFRSYDDLEHKLILPIVRNSLRQTANLMSARESYAEKRTDFVRWAWDQVQSGLFETKEETRKVVDPLSGEEVTKTFKLIKRRDDGTPLHQLNPLAGSGIRLANFEIKSFVYAEKVQRQIATQQEALMAVETAIAEAKRAEQEAITAEAQGQANVKVAQYEEEQKKVRAVVIAQQEKEVARIAAERQLEVAKLERSAASEQKQREILLGQGEAARKRLVLEADGALKEKLAAYRDVMARWAQAYSKRQVPHVVLGGGGGGAGRDQATVDFNQTLQLLVAGQLGLDLSVPQGATQKVK